MRACQAVVDFTEQLLVGIAPAITVDDVDSAQLAGAVVGTIVAAYEPGVDQLAFTDTLNDRLLECGDRDIDAELERSARRATRRPCAASPSTTVATRPRRRRAASRSS